MAESTYMVWQKGTTVSGVARWKKEAGRNGTNNLKEKLKFFLISTLSNGTLNLPSIFVPLVGLVFLTIYKIISFFWKRKIPNIRLKMVIIDPSKRKIKSWKQCVCNLPFEISKCHKVIENGYEKYAQNWNLEDSNFIASLWKSGMGLWI